MPIIANTSALKMPYLDIIPHSSRHKVNQVNRDGQKNTWANSSSIKSKSIKYYYVIGTSYVSLYLIFSQEVCHVKITKHRLPQLKKWQPRTWTNYLKDVQLSCRAWRLELCLSRISQSYHYWSQWGDTLPSLNAWETHFWFICGKLRKASSSSSLRLLRGVGKTWQMWAPVLNVGRILRPSLCFPLLSSFDS